MDKKKKIWFSIAIVLAVISLTGCLISIQNDGSMFSNVIRIVLICLVVLYMLFGYAKPHGNLLKGIMLIYAFALPMIVIPLSAQSSISFFSVIILEVMLITYMAGRLHKYKNNVIIFIIVLILMIASRVIGLINNFIITTSYLDVFSEVIVFIDIFIAYVVRYKEHKEAGLLDAPKQETK